MSLRSCLALAANPALLLKRVSAEADPAPARAEPRAFSLLLQAQASFPIQLPAGAFAPSLQPAADGSVDIEVPAGKALTVGAGRSGNAPALLLQPTERLTIPIPPDRATSPEAPDLQLSVVGGGGLTWRFPPRRATAPAAAGAPLALQGPHVVTVCQERSVRIRFPRGTAFRPPLGATIDPLPRTATLPKGAVPTIPRTALSAAAAADPRVRVWIRAFVAREHERYLFEERPKLDGR